MFVGRALFRRTILDTLATIITPMVSRLAGICLFAKTHALAFIKAPIVALRAALGRAILDTLAVQWIPMIASVAGVFLATILNTFAG